MKSGVYKITNTHNRRVYVGSSVDIRVRWRKHKRSLDNGTHHNRKLQRAWAKHGGDVFVFEVLEHCADESLLSREQYWIDSLRPWYNAQKVAGSPLGTKKTAAQLKKQAATTRKLWESPEYREKQAAATRGRKQSDAHKAAKAAAQRDSEACKATIARLAVLNTGRPVSDETREKIRVKATGRILSTEAREKIGAAHKGKFVSEATREKLRVARAAQTARQREAQART